MLHLYGNSFQSAQLNIAIKPSPPQKKKIYYSPFKLLPNYLNSEHQNSTTNGESKHKKNKITHHYHTYIKQSTKQKRSKPVFCCVSRIFFCEIAPYGRIVACCNKTRRKHSTLAYIYKIHISLVFSLI